MELAAAAPPLLPGPPRTERIVTVPPTDVSDAELLVAIGKGDAAAFEELYRRYVRSVLGLALRRLGDRGRAEDAVQETFASVWRAAGTFKPERGPGAPWLYTVARNAIVDRARARTEMAVEPPDEPSGGRGPDEHAEAGDTAWRVHRALAVLPEHERAVIELAYFGEMSQSEIAGFLGIPLGTVKTRTRAGLARLADSLEELR